MIRSRPFHRIHAVIAAVAHILTLPLAVQSEALSKIDYRSRGKGRGGAPRNYMRKVNHRPPHQGAQECARRRIGGWANNYAFTDMGYVRVAKRDVPQSALGMLPA